MRDKKAIIVCKNCSGTREIYKSAQKQGKGVFCSKKCFVAFGIQAHLTPEQAHQKGLSLAAGRWKGHIAVSSTRAYRRSAGRRINGRRIKKTAEELLAKKRFRNQRYKAQKVAAEGSHTFIQWLELKHKFHNMCLCCKRFEPEIKLTEDHIIPLSMGGSDNIDNIQPLCVSCNTRKHAKNISYLPSSSNSLIYAGKGLVN